MRTTIFIHIFLFVILSLSSTAQTQSKAAGRFSLGTRVTGSVFGEEATGMGLGGQFRLQFSEKVNSEWFADYITSNINDRITRNDYHIGWSLMFYVGKKKDFTNVLQPYILAGHCFDYTKVSENRNAINYQDRWSMAMQAGAGTHINITPDFDF